ncbi:unnamed protein product [Euphydryas editha]|uniref:Uncharacterized protein n=1 Tax=Euphydryas editha TaxID=104508 RepID=A0AAU9U9W3_EUPED|nr:unnamed protein product [Euphydryas editha]
MCVLLLSGIQKEDLDAKMLNKLQRYNVNIHDLNDNDLIQECTTFVSSNNRYTTPLTHEIENKSKVQKFSHEISEPDKDDNYKSPNFNAQEYNFNKNDLEKANKGRIIQYKDGQPELKSILNFWNDMKINNSIKNYKAVKKFNTSNEFTNENFRQEEKNKRNIPDALNSNESDIIQKLLLNFILKKRNKNVDEPVTSKRINIDVVYDDFHSLKKQNPKKNTEVNENYKFPLNFEATQMEQYSLNSEPMKKKIDRKPISEKNKSINSNNIYDVLNALQSLKINYPIISKDKNIEYLDGNNKGSMRSSENLFLDKYSRQRNIFTTETITPKITEQTLSQNVIKEIAQSVKELVLRDLRKEIFKTTSTITTTTVTETTTTKRVEIIPIIKKGDQIAEQSILSKFMDLFEEIKSLNLKSLIISSEAKKDVNKEATTYPARPKEYNDIYQPNYFIAKAYPNNNQQKIFDFSPQEHKFRSNAISEPVLRVPVKTLPITVQTNNIEIPPLGIPVDKPENPINQNIIVSTIKPYRMGNNKVGFNEIKLPDSRIEDFISKPSQNRYTEPQASIPYYTNQNNKKISLNKEHTDYDTTYNEKITLPGFKQSFHKSDEIKHPDVPRFHEQLERGVDYYEIPRKEYKNRVDCCDERYAYSKQMVECCQRKIASRQQMSLHDVKKQRSYDDTHFKNFLKSQQKVTDMLERILASRSRARSVEIA